MNGLNSIANAKYRWKWIAIFKHEFIFKEKARSNCIILDHVISFETGWGRWRWKHYSISSRARLIYWRAKRLNEEIARWITQKGKRDDIEIWSWALITKTKNRWEIEPAGTRVEKAWGKSQIRSRFETLERTRSKNGLTWGFFKLFWTLNEKSKAINQTNQSIRKSNAKRWKWWILILQSWRVSFIKTSNQ